MNFLKGEQKSWTTRQSDVNPNTAIENSFLEGFFKHTLADLHQTKILNFRQKPQHSQGLQASTHSLAESLFQVSHPTSLQHVMDNLSSFFLKSSPSFADGELNQLLEMKYSNSPETHPTYAANELLLVDVKIKADSERIAKMPLRMKEMLASLEHKERQNCPLAERLHTYKQKHINFMVVYFGYYNFDLVKNTHFEDQSIFLFGRHFQLRVNAIFVSKVALMETFKTVCKVPNLQEIDELLIQLYELKRMKAKAKKARNQQKELNKSKREKTSKAVDIFKAEQSQNFGLKALIGITAVGAAVALSKMFS